MPDSDPQPVNGVPKVFLVGLIFFLLAGWADDGRGVLIAEFCIVVGVLQLLGRWLRRKRRHS